jgi:hypothetical protein
MFNAEQEGAGTLPHNRRKTASADRISFDSYDIIKQKRSPKVRTMRSAAINIFDIVNTPYGDCTVVVAKRRDGFLQLEPIDWELAHGTRATFYMQEGFVTLKKRAVTGLSSNEGASSSSSAHYGGLAVRAIIETDDLLKRRRSRSDLDDIDVTVMENSNIDKKEVII